MASDWIEQAPLLRGLDEPTKTLLRESAIRKQIPRGAILFRPGDQCVQFPLIVSGTVRIQRITESGREIVLYRVSTNETCILTTASLLSADNYAAEGVAETDVVAYIVPSERFAALMNASSGFRAIVFDGYSRRIATLMSRIEEIVCTRINVRLAERLLALRGAGDRISVTQQALAADLGTAREVVGRTLKSFERSGWVKLSRGGAEITDAAALRALCEAERD
ncbi:MAG: Crp/Fnr family transcriptional regulator [Methylocystis sp.]|nr:MAG: Crp/Fnr family transcriptional regulator [Methylocystis sp.]